MNLTIEKLIYGGDGLARLPADERGRGKAVFVPFVLAGEIVEASPERIEPRCPYFARCGGCHYQHTSYEHQLTIKAEILKENLRRLAKLELTTDVEAHTS